MRRRHRADNLGPTSFLVSQSAVLALVINKTAARTARVPTGHPAATVYSYVRRFGFIVGEHEPELGGKTRYTVLGK